MRRPVGFSQIGIRKWAKALRRNGHPGPRNCPGFSGIAVRELPKRVSGNLRNPHRPHSSLDGRTPDQAYFNQPMPKAVAA